MNVHLDSELFLAAEGAVENKRGSVQWTIKNVDASVVSKTKEAARKKGMKIGAWVEMALDAAAANVLDGTPSNSDPLQRDIFRIVEIVEEIRKREIEGLQGIKDDIGALMKGQHGIMTKILSHQS